VFIHEKLRQQKEDIDDPNIHFEGDTDVEEFYEGGEE
jgi:hypothetical protein